MALPSTRRGFDLNIGMLDAIQNASAPGKIYRWADHCHVVNFALDHNGLITFSIFMRACQINAKGQIIVKEKNY